MASKFNWSGGVITYLGRHGAVRMGMLAVALASTVVSSASTIRSSPYYATEMKPFEVQVLGAFKTDAAQFLASANKSATAKGAANTCFGTQLDGHFDSPEIQARVERSTIYLIAHNKAGHVVDGGTGTKVSNSGGMTLTALHVSKAFVQEDVVSFKAYDSKGRSLGDVSQIANGRPLADTDINITHEGFADIGVVSITPNEPEEKSAFDDVPGLDLAPVQFETYETAIMGSATLPGTWHGHSGSALLDSSGHIRAVLTTGQPMFWGHGGDVTVTAHYIESGKQDDIPVKGILIPRATRAGFVGLGDHGILKSLGEAGKGITIVQDSPEDIRGPNPPPLMVAGYGMFGCLASIGRIESDLNVLGVGFDMVKNEMQAQREIDAVDRGRMVTEGISRNSQMGLGILSSSIVWTQDTAAMDGPPVKIDGWRQDGAGWTHRGEFGDYHITAKDKNQQLVFIAAGGDSGLSYIANLPAENSGQQRPNLLLVTLAARHEQVFSEAHHAMPHMQAAFSVQAVGNCMMEICKLDNKISFPPYLGPAVRLIAADGSVFKETFYFDGKKLGTDASTSIAEFDAQFPEYSNTSQAPKFG